MFTWKANLTRRSYVLDKASVHLAECELHSAQCNAHNFLAHGNAEKEKLLVTTLSIEALSRLKSSSIFDYVFIIA